MDHILTCILNDDKAGSTNAAEARALIGRRQIVGLHGEICRSFRLLALAVEALLWLVTMRISRRSRLTRPTCANPWTGRD